MKPRDYRYSTRRWREVRKMVLLRDNFTCQLRIFPVCKVKADGVDHILPITKGGSDSLGNLRASCRPCNSSKKDSLVGPVVTVNW